jgi:dihydropteroate synthase
LQCGDKIITLDVPRVMGILNLTPDSFYDGGRYQLHDQYLSRTEQMLNEGADIIDIGAISTKPGSSDVTEKEEMQRLLRALSLLVRKFPKAIFSVDTFRSSVAKYAAEAGAGIINDISGGNLDEQMFETVASLNIPYILMHMRGIPSIMQLNPTYGDVVSEIDQFFRKKVAALKEVGVNQVIIDPGFGFGKTIEHNYKLLKHLEIFKKIGPPILIGVSRKSMINKLLKIKPEEALNATSALHTLALLKGADILRVHDVKEAVQVIKVVNAFQNGSD